MHGSPIDLERLAVWGVRQAIATPPPTVTVIKHHVNLEAILGTQIKTLNLG